MVASLHHHHGHESDQSPAHVMLSLRACARSDPERPATSLIRMIIKTRKIHGTELIVLKRISTHSLSARGYAVSYNSVSYDKCCWQWVFRGSLGHC